MDAKDLYVLADGTHGDPGECRANDKGVLCHANGVPVALKADGKPMTVGDAAVEGYNQAAADAADGTPVKPLGTPDPSGAPPRVRTERRPAGILTTGDLRPAAPATATAPHEPKAG